MDTPHASPTIILSIAGSDTSAGAGIQADIKTASLCNAHAITAITCVTAQSTNGITDIFELPSSSLNAQLKAALADVTPSAVKIGMVGSVDKASLIVSFLDSLPPDTPVVIDPVLSATSGRCLVGNNDSLVKFYLDELLPRATIATPNLIEAVKFLQISNNLPDKYSLSQTAISNAEDLLEPLLNLFCCKGVVLKGGHGDGNTIRDLFVERKENDAIFTDAVENPRIFCDNLHGTGCCYSTALTVNLAKGYSYSEAFRKASAFVWQRIYFSTGNRYGSSINGPLNLITNCNIENYECIDKQCAMHTPFSLHDCE